MATYTPETRDSNNIKPVSYSEMQDWLANQSGDFTDKIAELINKNGKNEPINLDRSPDNANERRKPGTELLARYLHHLHEQGKLNLFEEVYKERFSKQDEKKGNSPKVTPVTGASAISVIPVDPAVPTMEDIISSFDSCCSEPKIDTIKHLESLLAQLQYACKVYSIAVPGILTELETVLFGLNKATYAYEEAKRDTEQESAKLQQEFELANEQYKTTIELSADFKRKKKAKKKSQGNNEMLLKAGVRVRKLTNQLKTLGKKLEINETKQDFRDGLSKLRGISGVQLKQELQGLTNSLGGEKAKKRANEEDKKTIEEEKRKADEKAKKAAEEEAEKRLPVPIDGASVVYLCMSSAEDFAEFLVRSQSVDFGGLSPDAGKIKQILAIDIFRQTADDILGEFPFLNGLKVSADIHEIEEYMSAPPAVHTENMVKLIEYLKFLATSARNHGKWEGAGKQDLTLLKNFVRNLEQIVIDRLTPALNQCPFGVKPYEWAPIIANRQFFDHVDSTYHNPQQTKRALKAIPERSHINKPSVIRTTIRNFIQDLYDAVGKPKEGDGPITKTFKDALRALAGKKDERVPPSPLSASPPSPPEPEHRPH